MECEIETELGLVDLPLTLCWCDYSRQDKMELEVTYSSIYFMEEDIEDYCSRLFLILDKICDTQQELKALELVTADEKLELSCWNETSAGYPSEKCIHELFEGQVEKHPENIAVVI